MRKKLRIGKVGNRRVLQVGRTAWVSALRQEDIYWTESQPVWLEHGECTWGDARQRLIYVRSMDFGIYFKSYWSHWRICRRKARHLRFVFQSSICCVWKWLFTCLLMPDSATPLTAAHQLLYPWNSPGKNTGVGSHSFLYFTSSFSNSVNILFLFQSLFCLCWVVIAVSWLSRVTAAVHRLLIAVASLVLEHRL